MGHQKMQRGFTIAEVLVTLGILSLFLALFFQTYMLSMSQKNTVILRAVANDIAQSNLRKISTKADIPSSGVCDNSPGGSNQNNVQINSNAPGSVFARGTAADPAPSGEPNPWTGNLAPEQTSGSGLPASTVQSLSVLYPKGCNSAMPAEIISTVSYGTESIVHAIYINSAN